MNSKVKHVVETMSQCNPEAYSILEEIVAPKIGFLDLLLLQNLDLRGNRLVVAHKFCGSTEKFLSRVRDIGKHDEFADRIERAIRLGKC